MSLRPSIDDNAKRHTAAPCTSLILAGAPIGGPLFSDAIALKPGSLLGASHHPTTSVGLRANVPFVPQYAKSALPDGDTLNISAMVASRHQGIVLENTGTNRVKDWWGKKKVPSRVSDGAKEAASKAKDVAKGVAGKAKDVAKEAVKKKWDRFTNEDRITKMERYDYFMYSSQPLKNVMLKAGQGSVRFDDNEDPLSLPTSAKNFYGLLAVANKKVTVDKRGARTFELESKKTWLQNSPLDSTTLQPVFRIEDPDAAAMIDVATLKDAKGNAVSKLYHGTDLTKGVDEVIQRVRAQTRVQTEGIAAANDASQLKWRSGAAQRLCFGHSMMTPLENVLDTNDDRYTFLREMLPSEFLKSIEQDLTWSSLRQGFQEELNSDGASQKPYIVPMLSSYLKGSEAETSADYARAFPEGSAGPGQMRPISALLVVPIDSDTLTNANVFQHNNGCLTMEYTRLYPWLKIGENAAYMNKRDAAMDLRTMVNQKYEMELQTETEKNKGTPPNNEWKEKKVHEIAREVGYADDNGNRTPNAEASASWCMTPENAAKKFKVAVFALGVDKNCTDGGSNASCQAAFDQNDKNDKSGKVLTIGTHPLLLGDVVDSDGVSKGFEAPGTVWMSHGQGQPLKNAAAAAVAGEHIDVRFLWAAMKLMQCSWNKATNSRTSELTRTKFRKLIGMPMSKWKTPNTPIDKLNMVKGNAYLPVRNDENGDKFGASLIRMGLVNATGAPKSIEDLTIEEVEAAMIAANMDLDDCCALDSNLQGLC